MATPVMPLRRIRIHKQRGFGTWSAYCPCCWNEGAPTRKCIASDLPTFDDARDWADDHIMQTHPRQPCCPDASCPACNPWPDTYGAP
jgi:hypothetical protein